MPVNIDQTADTAGVQLARLAKLYSLPDFVKQADLAQLRAPGVLSSGGYADPVRRQYPCNTAAGTWLSYAYYLDKQAEWNPKDRARIEDRLDKMAAYWRIVPAVQQLKEQHAAYIKTADDALPDSSFAYVWTNPETGHKLRTHRLRNAVEVKMAADWLVQYRERLPLEDRHVMATKILEKAAQFGAGITTHLEFLERQAGRGVGDPQEITRQIEYRAKLASHPQLRGGILQLAEAVRDKPRQALQPDTLIKLAVALDQLDTQMNLRQGYGDVLRRPEDVIFAVTLTKAAADMASVCATPSGRVYRRQHLERLKVADLRELFGDDFIDQVCDGTILNTEKLAEVVSTLPQPDAVLFDQLMHENGLAPEMVRKTADAPRVPDWGAFAREYVSH